MILHKFFCHKKLFNNIIIIFRNKYEYKNRNSIMPRNNKNYLHELQKQRKQLKAQSVKYVPSRITLQIIGNGTPAEPRCVLLQTDHTYYLFNCGEGSQRLSSEHHSKFTKLEHIFVTKTSWNNIGGILGTALTLQETGVPLIKLHGPEGIVNIIEASKNFTILNELKIESTNLNKQFNDHTMTVTYVPIHNPAKLRENEYNHEINSNGKRIHSCSSQLIKSKSIDSMNQNDDVIIYICKVHDKIGPLNVDKCLKAGITHGPDLGKLKSGLDITLPNGDIIKSKDMVSESKIGPLFIVMECPNEDWIDNIIQNSVFEKHQVKTATDEEQIAKVIIHFTPESVLKNSKYREWMHKFGTDTQHLIINEKNSGFSSESIYKMQCMLNLVHPTIFPCFDKNVQNKNKDEKFENHVININKTAELNDSSELKIDENVKLEVETPNVENKLFIHQCKTLDSFSLRPFTGLNTKNNIEFDSQKYINEALDTDGFRDALTALQTELTGKTESIEDLLQYPRLLMLGTGSCIPNKIRNTSGILLQLDENRSILLDCGEGTVKQIIKFFGETEGYHVLKTIKAVYVSHLHADHHIGFIGILKCREQVTDEPLLLLAPETISLFLNTYDSEFEAIKHQYKLIPLRTLLLDQSLLQVSLLKQLLETLNISKINTVFVKHCTNAFGVAITLKDGRKICYSGDTMPCDSLVQLAKDSFLLIHEATMEDDLITEAIVKRHSTMSQAIETGKKANANFTLLTHFSQRYCKLPILPKNKSLKSIGVAYDFMIISLLKIELLSLFYPALSVLFQEFRVQLEERAVKRGFKKENLREANIKI